MKTQKVFALSFERYTKIGEKNIVILRKKNRNKWMARASCPIIGLATGRIILLNTRIVACFDYNLVQAYL